MKILLTNDDGIDAPGINILSEELKKAGHDIYIVAPHKEQSATSHSITLHQPMRIYKRDDKTYAVTGTPTDCVILASQVIMKEGMDLIISGINNGQNMGEDVLYSGTVAAAIEGMFLGFKAIAVSLTSFTDQKYETAARFIKRFLDNGIKDVIGEQEILNINVPNVELHEIKGVKVTHLTHRRYVDFVAEQTDPRGEKIYWIGGNKPLWDTKQGSDAEAVFANYVSITPIKPQFTNKTSLGKLNKWVENLD